MCIKANNNQEMSSQELYADRVLAGSWGFFFPGAKLLLNRTTHCTKQ
jgi:hypothetical protein